MEININKRFIRAMDVWNKNLVDATLNMVENGEENTKEFVKEHFAESSGWLAENLFTAIHDNYGELFSMSVTTWKH